MKTKNLAKLKDFISKNELKIVHGGNPNGMTANACLTINPIQNMSSMDDMPDVSGGGHWVYL